ncbi:NAD(P)H-dependent glycerol-3-phosphate dehydrogenase, partial [Streptococcus suis]
RGEKLEDVERNMGMVIEGISTTKAAYELAQELGVYMPITQAIYKVIYQGAGIEDAIKEIMTGEFRHENEWS